MGDISSILLEQFVFFWPRSVDMTRDFAMLRVYQEADWLDKMCTHGGPNMYTVVPF